MKLEQKRGGIFVSYDFGDTAILYSTSDNTGEYQGPIRYETIDVKRTFTLRRSASKQITVAFYLAGLALIVMSMTTHDANAAEMFRYAALAFLLFAIASKYKLIKGVKQTIFKAAERQIRVLHGKNHDAIVNEIKRRWADRMRQLYAKLDLSADLNNEAQRFRWLRENDVINDEECAKALNRIAIVQSEGISRDGQVELLN